MANMTGLNPEVAAAELEEFAGEYFNAHDDLYIELQEMLNGLSLNWYSPKAVEFGRNYLPRLASLMNTVVNRGNRIRYDATLAYNDLARSNGIGTLPEPHFGTADGVYFMNVVFKEIGDSGIVGMDIEKVKNSVLPNGYHAIKRVLNEFDELPLNIAFYDPEGELKARYKTMINMLKMDIMNLVNEMSRSIISALETEASVIATAKSEAVSTLSENA